MLHSLGIYHNISSRRMLSKTNMMLTQIGLLLKILKGFPIVLRTKSHGYEALQVLTQKPLTLAVHGSDLGGFLLFPCFQLSKAACQLNQFLYIWVVHVIYSLPTGTSHVSFCFLPNSSNLSLLDFLSQSLELISVLLTKGPFLQLPVKYLTSSYHCRPNSMSISHIQYYSNIIPLYFSPNFSENAKVCVKDSLQRQLLGSVVKSPPGMPTSSVSGD